jgi:hypothetical protein
MKAMKRVLTGLAAFLLTAGISGSQTIQLRVTSPENYYTVLRGTNVVFEMTNSGIGNAGVYAEHIPDCPAGTAGWCFHHGQYSWNDYPNPTPTIGTFTWNTTDVGTTTPEGFPTGGCTIEGGHEFLCYAVVGDPPVYCESARIAITLIASLSTPGLYVPDPAVIASNASYNVHWDWTAGSEGYELQESTDNGFGAGSTTTYAMNGISGFSRDFTHSVGVATVFYYRVRAVNTTVGQNSGWTPSGPTAAHVHIEPASAVESRALPEEDALEQNYPNPFNPGTDIRFTLKRPGRVRLGVFDLAGREVIRLAEGPFEAGSHTVRFNSAGFPSGMYYYRIQSGDFIAARKMFLIK